MAAYAALCSLMHIIHQIQNHPRPPVSLDEQQVESLTEKVTFLQEFFEGYSDVGGYTKEADPLESCIADAAHAAEDVIESHIVDRIHAGSTSHGVEMSSSVDFYQSLQKVIGKMDSIKKQVMEMKNKMRVGDHQQHGNWITSANSSRPTSTVQDTMVGFDDALLEIMDKLTGGDHGRQVIPIVGMGGMGKTTLTRNVYVSPLIQQYFDICAWATISQEYDAREILREILCLGNQGDQRDIEELGEKLHKHLFGRRYLIVLDDMWCIEAWDEVRMFFPDNKNGSRIVITTRLSKLSSQLTGSYCLEMKFLDEEKSWNLLCKTVFGKEGCPVELEQIGKKIANNCRGLPLSIVVTGGLLVKSKHSSKYWNHIAENLNSLVNSEDNERCLNILYMSYKHMSVYLKPCFLYMGIYSEDCVIRATELIRLWVAEGFLKPKSGKSLEKVAEECLEELIDRNLVRALQRCDGKINECSIHDLLRDLCLREAQKERFYYVKKEHSFSDSNGMNNRRRIVIPKRELQEEEEEVVDELQSIPLARSLICDNVDLPMSLNFRLLRILDALHIRIGFPEYPYLLENMFHLVNSRYIAIRVNPRSEFPSSVCLLWNLQTLIVDSGDTLTAPSEIWMMPQLKHVEFLDGLYLPDPPTKDDDIIVLTDLHCLSKIVNFKCSEEVILRIPNLKTLKIQYKNDVESSHYFEDNLDRLHKLESFCCVCYSDETNFLHKLSFPHSLKELILDANHPDWAEVMDKIGSLPLLEDLTLRRGSFRSGAWETVEGQFSSLKFLMVWSLHSLQYWNSESTHFPRLEQLVLQDLRDLKEIPLGIGEIPTLESIDLEYCSYSAAVSAKKILEEQEELGDVTLRIRVTVFRSVCDEGEMEALKSLASPNFQVRCY